MEEANRQLKKIELATRITISNFILGNHQSIFKGKGEEFHQIRKYEQGDDFRKIDWKSTARLGAHLQTFPFYVKENREERNLDIYFILDVSGSMNFGRVKQKVQKAKRITKDLIYSLGKNRDNMGLFLCTNQLEQKIRARGGIKQIKKLHRLIDNYVPVFKKSDLDSCLKSISGSIKKRSIFFIISDFKSDSLVISSLNRLRRKHDVIALHISDSSERNIPNLGEVELEDLENGEQFLCDTSDKYLRERYAKAIQKRRDILKNQFLKLRISHLFLDTDQYHVRPLIKMFKDKKRMMVS